MNSSSHLRGQSGKSLSATKNVPMNTTGMLWPHAKMKTKMPYLVAFRNIFYELSSLPSGALSEASTSDTLLAVGGGRVIRSRNHLVLVLTRAHNNKEQD